MEYPLPCILGIKPDPAMPQSYFRIALRHLRKNGSFAVLNISGLAIGLAVCLLITLFVTDELHYDRYNEKADRIYRVVSDIHFNGNGLTSINGPAPLGAALVADYPGIEQAVRIRAIPTMAIRLGNAKIIEHNGAFADSSLFEVLTLPLIAGNPHTALTEPYTLVISESMAKKYFADRDIPGKAPATDILGKTLVTDDSTVYTITGVMRDMPAQSHFHFGFIKAMAEKKLRFGLQWVNFFAATYVLAKPGVGTADIDRMLAASVTKYIGPQLQQEMHSSLGDLAKNGDYFRFYTMPLTHIHLYSHVTGEFEPNGRIQIVGIFIVIAFLILGIACCNFMNLSTACSADRSREVGVRKVLGSSRRGLIARYLAESILTCFIALLLAILITAALLPSLNHLTDKHIALITPDKKWIGCLFLLSPLVVGLLAGSYPAFYLSSFQPIQVLQGRLATGFKGGRLRNSLVVFQFVTAITLIIGTLVIYSQLRYIRSRDPGYNRNQVLTINHTDNLGGQVRAFVREAEKLSGVTGSTMTGFLPNRVDNGSRGYFIHATAKASETVLLDSWRIDANYIPLLELTIIRGRNFSPSLATDSFGVVINETAARLLGYTDPINKSLYTGPDQVTEYHILGVVKDFNAGTLRSKIEPLVFHLAEDNHAVSFRTRTGNLPGLIAAIQKLYRSMGGQDFSYSFMDDDFNKLYRSDERTGEIFLAFALLTVLIACLGLFGLVAYAAEQRTKEIGIRKVLGATIRDIVELLSKDFLKLVFLAALIAYPLAWWGMQQWLQGFAYRTVVSWWIFILAGTLALTITLLTVGWQAMKAGMANPVKSLRAE